MCRCRLWQRLLVQSLLQKRDDTAARRPAEHHGPLTGSLEASGSKAFRQIEQPETTAIAHLRVRSVLQQMFDQVASVWTHLDTPVKESSRGPFHVGPMRLGHMLSIG